ncbi:MAG: ABC transporter permease [Nitrospina sp.]|jgi:oligopeptide transport system permease protein|nr:ABC transporter permease [Nitrospina sp.]MBT3508180.1 ABC transporter permease [Nitrospina sp.]MBT3874841.1 ABC transporter permease [Nitrospina sp.]MBT4047997.1 ABC transporter permease [Nitrospina sp.]MBT4555956.1 ABC transporter permease [Nitrospina sp.]
MLRFIIRRILLGIPVLVTVATLTFIIMHWVPGGPFDSDKILPPEIIANIEAKYHLDKPLPLQYLLYMKQLLQGDLGPSYKYLGRDVSDIIRDTFPVSFTLGLCAVLVVLGLGIPAGMISAYWKNSLLDRSVLLFAAMGISVPSFVLGAILVWIFSHHWHLLPPALWEGPRHMVLPAFALGAGFAGYIARLTRTTLLDVLDSDYIRTARAKGLTESTILFKHALKNSIYPIVSVMGPLTAGLITGSFVIEYIFSIPGMGRFFITAVTNRDYPLIMGVTLVYAVLIVIANTIVDMVYSWLDPRVTLK